MTDLLLVDDDRDLRALLTTHFTAEGFSLRTASTMNEALAAVAERAPDLVLLDIVLGTEDGRDVLRELRQLSDVPVIFLTGRGLESDRIAGLKMGADDYVVKPFSLGELSARVESVLRRGTRPAPATTNAMDFGTLVINDHTHEVTLNGELLELTAKEYSLLVFLATSPRQVFSREQLLEHVWSSSGEWQNEATVTEHIRRLRHKIESDPESPKWITTVRGFGYRFEPSQG